MSETTSGRARPAGRLRRTHHERRARLGLLATLGAAGAAAWSALAPRTPPPPPPTGEAVTADIAQTVLAAGVLQPRTKVDVGAQVSGQVQKIHVQLGQQVRKGELLVSLDPALAESDVAQADAAVAQQAALIDSTRASLSLARREAERQHRLLGGEATAATEAERADTDLARLEGLYRRAVDSRGGWRRSAGFRAPERPP